MIFENMIFMLENGISSNLGMQWTSFQKIFTTPYREENQYIEVYENIL